MITMYYDNTCKLCSSNATHLQHHHPDKIAIIPVNDALDTLTKIGISRIEAMTYVVVTDENNKVYMGMEAVRLLDSTAGRFYAPLLYMPMIKQLSDWAYPYIARNRYYFPSWLIRLIYGRVVTPTQLSCDNGVCQIPPSKRHYND